MDTFTALVVDDDAQIRSDAGDVFREHPSIRVYVCGNVDEAREIIASRFLNAAFVDIQLTDGNYNIDGITILRELYDVRPSCKRFLLTKYLTEYRQEIFDLLHPLNPIINGALDKTNFGHNFLTVLQELAQKWLATTIKVERGDEVYGQLTKKKVGSNLARLSLEEVDFLVATLLGQDSESLARTKDDVASISLSLLEGGRSRSVVALGRPRTGAGGDGIYCVIKVGPKEEVQEEYQRYGTYVRYLLSLNRRVELLGYASADNLGAMCYSFAGASPEKVRSLGALFDRGSESALRYVRLLADPKTKEWYSHKRTGRDLAGFFFREYGVNANDVLTTVFQFADKIGSWPGIKRVGNELQFSGSKLELPKDVIGSGKLRMAYTTCIVHGDLNPENVLIGGDDPENGDCRVISIDFRYTGWGPRALDFAALEAGLRIRQETSENSLPNDMAGLHVERKVWQTAWSGRELGPSLPYWARLSVQLAKLARENFPDISAAEYAATCFLWSLRLFRVTALSDGARLRLLLWMSILQREID